MESIFNTNDSQVAPGRDVIGQPSVYFQIGQCGTARPSQLYGQSITDRCAKVIKREAALCISYCKNTVFHIHKSQMTSEG